MGDQTRCHGGDECHPAIESPMNAPFIGHSAQSGADRAKAGAGFRSDFIGNQLYILVLS
jgi:hypothetical protein